MEEEHAMIGRIKKICRILKYFALPAALLVSGCAAVGPDYIRPEIQVPQEWHTKAPEKIITGRNAEGDMSHWWTTLNDPVLSGLIERAVRGNLDVKKAQASVREARAQMGVARAGFLPSLNGSASAAWSRDNNNTNTTLYAAGFDAAWELDIFGGVRRTVEAYRGDLDAAEEDRRDVLVTLLAEVATNYIDVRTYQARLASAKANLASQVETAQLVQWQNEAGLSDDLSVQQARYNLESTRSDIPTLNTGLEGAMNRIAVLLGEQPGRVHDELSETAKIPVPPLEIALSIPAEVLRNRPDIRRAERQLAAQTARVGVATADLYPKLTLNGSVGLEASDLVSSALRTVSGGPSLSWAIFQGGALRQKIEIQSALQEQAAIKYESTVLGALEEVENALTAFKEEQARKEALQKAVQAAGQAAELSQKEYEAGLTNFLTVLDAQRSLLSFQDQLVKSEGAVANNLVKLYKAFGGGWESLSSKYKDYQNQEGGRNGTDK